MNTTEIIITIIISFAAGAIISYILVKTQWSAKLTLLQGSYDNLKNTLEQQNNFLASSEQVMKNTFTALAADALHKNNQTFVSLAESKLNEKVTEAKGLLDGKEKAIDSLVVPLKASLDKMETKINDLEIKREGAYTNIQTILEGMQRSAQALDKGTQNLISALKNSGMRGRYGEIGLRRVVEFAGMTEHCDFIEQVNIQGDSGTQIPDMIINLPEKKTIIVDAKTPLDAYMKAFETDNEIEQQTFLNQHVAAVKSHLKSLSGKSYWSQFDNSPDYVVLYMQIESSFAAALQADPTLIEEGIRHKIIFATPTTLITLLRTVGFVWQQRHVADNIEQIRDAGVELFNRTAILLNHFSNIGGSLKSVVENYNKAVSSLEARFTPQARKLYALGSAYTKNTIPEINPVEQTVRNIEAPDTPTS